MKFSRERLGGGVVHQGFFGQFGLSGLSKTTSSSVNRSDQEFHFPLVPATL